MLFFFMLCALFAFAVVDAGGAGETDPAGATGGEPGKETLTPAATGQTERTPEAATGESKTFTQVDVDRIVEKRLAEEKARHQKAIEEGKAAAEKKRLAEQGEWQRLYEEQKAENERLKSEMTAKERETLCFKIAAKHKLPEDLATRLVGETEAEIEADAARLAKHLAPPKPPVLDEKGLGSEGSTLTTEERIAAARKTGRYAA